MDRLKDSIPLVLNEEALPIVEQISEGLPGGFFIYRADGEEEIIYANNNMLKIFGCETEEEFLEATGGTFKGLVHPDDIDEVEKSIKEQIEANDDNKDYVEYRIVRRDYAIRWIVDYGHLVHTEQYGDLFYVFIDDATDRHLKELENERKNKVIEGLCCCYNAVYLIDFEWKSMMRYHLDNMVAARMLKHLYDSQDYSRIFGTYIEKYVVESEKDYFEKEINIDHIRQRLKTERAYSVNFHRYDDNGVVEYIQMFIARIDGENGELHAVMGFKNIY